MDKLVEIEFWDLDRKKEYIQLAQKVLEQCFTIEHMKDKNMYITVIYTTPEQIQKTNRTYRHMDKQTDVLSFPMFEREEIKKIEKSEVRDTLGDILISIERVREQAIEYGHSFERELAYMLVHGFYHLMGYDHIEEQEKEEMRQKEEFILELLNITRNKK